MDATSSEAPRTVTLFSEETLAEWGQYIGITEEYATYLIDCMISPDLGDFTKPAVCDSAEKAAACVLAAIAIARAARAARAPRVAYREDANERYRKEFDRVFDLEARDRLKLFENRMFQDETIAYEYASWAICKLDMELFELDGCRWDSSVEWTSKVERWMLGVLAAVAIARRAHGTK